MLLKLIKWLHLVIVHSPVYGMHEPPFIPVYECLWCALRMCFKCNAHAARFPTLMHPYLTEQRCLLSLGNMPQNCFYLLSFKLYREKEGHV